MKKAQNIPVWVALMKNALANARMKKKADEFEDTFTPEIPTYPEIGHHDPDIEKDPTQQHPVAWLWTGEELLTGSTHQDIYKRILLPKYKDLKSAFGVLSNNWRGRFDFESRLISAGIMSLSPAQKPPMFPHDLMQRLKEEYFDESEAVPKAIDVNGEYLIPFEDEQYELESRPHMRTVASADWHYEFNVDKPNRRSNMDRWCDLKEAALQNAEDEIIKEAALYEKFGSIPGMGKIIQELKEWAIPIWNHKIFIVTLGGILALIRANPGGSDERAFTENPMGVFVKQVEEEQQKNPELFTVVSGGPRSRALDLPPESVPDDSEFRASFLGHPSPSREELPEDLSYQYDRTVQQRSGGDGLGLSEPVDLSYWYDKIIHQESRGDPVAVSEKGATGVMQIMPDTWADLTNEPYSRATDPVLNKKMGIKYLQQLQNWLTEGWRENAKVTHPGVSGGPGIEHILAAYNGGIGRLTENDYDVWAMPEETKDYIKKITGMKRPKGMTFRSKEPPPSLPAFETPQTRIFTDYKQAWRPEPLISRHRARQILLETFRRLGEDAWNWGLVARALKENPEVPDKQIGFFNQLFGEYSLSRLAESSKRWKKCLSTTAL